MHLHFLVTEGGTDEAGVFHKIPRIDDPRLTEIFGPRWAKRLLSWPYTGFNVHSLVRARTKIVADFPLRQEFRFFMSRDMEISSPSPSGLSKGHDRGPCRFFKNGCRFSKRRACRKSGTCSSIRLFWSRPQLPRCWRNGGDPETRAITRALLEREEVLAQRDE